MSYQNGATQLSLSRVEFLRARRFSLSHSAACTTQLPCSALMALIQTLKSSRTVVQKCPQMYHLCLFAFTHPSRNALCMVQCKVESHFPGGVSVWTPPTSPALSRHQGVMRGWSAAPRMCHVTSLTHTQQTLTWACKHPLNKMPMCQLQNPSQAHSADAHSSLSPFRTPQSERLAHAQIPKKTQRSCMHCCRANRKPADMHVDLRSSM